GAPASTAAAIRPERPCRARATGAHLPQHGSAGEGAAPLSRTVVIGRGDAGSGGNDLVVARARPERPAQDRGAAGGSARVAI
ncbi:MAG: hypothetical protein AVDCRST_MAG91-1145, partial [uncultured Sphingomonadaceae bacterium]